MRKILLLVIAVITSLGAWAQGVTTSSITGVIKDKNGEALPGATIIAVHEPTGAQYGTISRPDGHYTIPNVRVGGPYTLTVSFVGYENQELKDIIVTLGSAVDANFSLLESGTQLSEVLVTASKGDVFNTERTGAMTNISNKQITQLPTLSRSLNDYIRLTPQANGLSFGGRSDGYNNVTVDGALFNNAFGLASTVGGQANAQPISLDAIDQITTAIAPYDVTQGSFTGAGVNVVTRSGTNEFSGSVYYFMRNQGLVGKKISGVENKYSDFKFHNFGFRVGGPIVKNKLFFFINGETERQNSPGTTYTANRGTTGSTISQVRAGQLDTLSNFLQNNYGYNPGPYENYKLQQNSDKATIKIDWNINRKHKFSIKYNFLQSYRDISASTSGAISAAPIGRSPSQYGLPFLGSYYRINNNLNSVIAELNSSISDKISNKFQIGYTAFRDFRETPTSGKIFPTVDIGNGSGQNLTAFGYEPFSAYNILNSNVIQLSDNVDIFLNRNTISVGTYNEFYHFENGFDPFFYGAYQFASLADFYASAGGATDKIKQYQLGYAATADGSFPLVKVKAMQLGFYAQDKIELTNNFNVTAGLRVDVPVINTTIGQNTAAAAFTFSENRKINTGDVQKSQLLWSPRVGFNWDVFGDKTTQIRGGSGIFTGRVPYVWISNQASNNGLLFGSKFYSTANATAAGLKFTDDVNAYRPTGAGAVAPANNPDPTVTYNLAVTDRNFKFPQVWRSNIAVDQKLPGGIVSSFDFAFTKDLNAVYHRNINLPTAPNTANGADNRPIYYVDFTAPKTSNSTANTRMNSKVTDAILMSNTNKGFSYFGTAQLRKTFPMGIDVSLAYTYTMAKSVNDGGSIAQSIWRDRAVSGSPNDNVLSYFTALARHRIMASANYRKEYAGFTATTIGFFYTLTQAGRFSYTYAGDMNGDNSGGSGNDLIYIPKNQSEIQLIDIKDKNGVVVYSAGQQWTDLDKYISQDKYLSGRRGQYAERNGAAIPWRGQLDIRLMQEFFVKVGTKRNTIQISFDMFNAGNALNSDWGVLKTPNRSTLLTFQGYDTNKTPMFTYPYLNANTRQVLNTTFRDDLGLISRYQMQFGIRYIFN